MSMLSGTQKHVNCFRQGFQCFCEIFQLSVEQIKNKKLLTGIFGKRFFLKNLCDGQKRRAWGSNNGKCAKNCTWTASSCGTQQAIHWSHRV